MKHPLALVTLCSLFVLGSSQPVVAQLAVPERPVSFVENRGQFDPAVRFRASCGATTAFFTDDAFVLTLLGESHVEGRVSGAHVFLTFEDSLDDVRLSGAGQRLGPVRSYRGNDSSRWVDRADSWSGLLYEGLYAGVDLAVLEREGSLAYDLLLAPGADPSAVVVRCEGATGLSLSDGRLIVQTAAGALVQTPPVAWQVRADGSRLPVDVAFRLLDDQRYGFDVDAAEAELPLVIDPGLTWGSVLGGVLSDRITAVVLAPDGDLLLTGSTGSPNFPTTPGAFQSSVAGFSDVLVTRLDPSTGTLVFSTFLGGNDTVIFRPEVGEDLALAADGSIVVAGTASSSDFPTTAGAAMPNSPGGTDAFVARLSSTGVLQWSTRLGGSGHDSAHSVVVAPDGKVSVAGHTFSNDLATTPGAFDESFNSVFLSNDIFVSRLTSDGSALDWCTYVGGVFRDESRDMILNPDGSLTIGGLSGSADFPTTAGAYDESYNGNSGTETDGVLLRLSSDGTSLMFSTFLGSSEVTEICGIAQSGGGDLVVVGTTAGADFPTTPGARQETYGGGLSDGFVARFDGSGSTLQWSTFLGGQGTDALTAVALDAGEQPTLTGVSGSSGLFHDLPPDLPFAGGGVTTSPAGPLTSGQAPSPGGSLALGNWTGNGSDTILDGGSDAVIVRLSPAGDELVWGSFHGGVGSDAGASLVLDAVGDPWVVGQGNSPDLPTTANGYDPTPNGSFDGFIAHFAVPPVFHLSLSGPGALLPGSGSGAPNAPRLLVAGSLWPGTPWAIDLDGCPPSTRVALLVGTFPSARPTPFGLLFVGSVQLVVPLLTDQEGRSSLSGAHWPENVPIGTQLVLQAWVAGRTPAPSNGIGLLTP